MVARWVIDHLMFAPPSPLDTPAPTYSRTNMAQYQGTARKKETQNSILHHAYVNNRKSALAKKMRDARSNIWIWNCRRIINLRRTNNL